MSLFGRGNKRSRSSVPTRMPTDPAISPRRRLLGSAALVATAGGLAAIAVHDVEWTEWGLLACAGVVGAAGVGLARRSMSAQVLARGTAWTVLVPSALVALVSTLSGGHPEWMAAALTAGSGGALFLSRPMLHTAEAKARFAPNRFRRWLLAASTASVTTGLVTGLFALDAMRWHPGAGIPLLALSLSLIGSAVGVVRMRAWGILLGALTSAFALLTAAAFMHDAEGLALALTAIPGFMLLLPVLIAQRDRARDETAQKYRVAAHVSSDAPARVRVATSASSTSDDEFDDASDTSTTSAPPPAARAQA